MKTPVEIRNMFYPENVAVVGASGSARNMGKNIVTNLVNWGFPGGVYPVNPRGEAVRGLKGYKSLDEVPAPVDLVVAFVPAGVVPEVMDQCHRNGVRSMAIPSGGFSEYGKEGERLSEVVTQKARDYGIRFVGPNGLTIINSENGLCLPFVELKKREPGSISIVSQSGGVGVTLIMLLDNAGRSLNKFVSVGNKLNMDEVDFLEFLAADQTTKVVCMFLESVVRGRRFLEAASGLDKPLVVYKANTTEAGHRTAMSHTAALANDDSVLNGVFKQGHVIRADSIRSLISIGRAFELPPMRGNRVAVISQAGGYTVLAADEVYRHGFEIPPFEEGMLHGFREHVRSDVIRMGNPLDLGDVHSSDAIVYTLDGIMAQEYIDGVVTVLIRRADAKYDGAYSGLHREVYGDLGDLVKKHQKPLSLALMTQCEYLRDVQNRMDYPVFESPEEAVKALASLRDYHRAVEGLQRARGQASSSGSW